MINRKAELEKAILVLGLIPLAFIISLLTFYFHAGIKIGHLPSYNLPDPKQLSIYSNYKDIVYLSIYISLLSIAGWLIVIIWYLAISKTKLSWKSLLISTFIHISAIMLFCSDILEWFVD